MNTVEKGFDYYIFMKKTGFFTMRIGMICRHDITTINDGNS